VAEDAAGEPWHFDVSGSFATTRSGLVRPDTLWRCLGQAGVLARRRIRPLVLLTSALPAPRSAGDRALREIGPDVVHDAIEVLAQGGLQRLAAYAVGGRADRPLPGFWTDAELGPPGFPALRLA